jgi:large subunit ribosomal protein L6
VPSVVKICMSRIGKQPIEIPDGVAVTLKDNTITAKGPLGELSVSYPGGFSVQQKDNTVIIEVVRKRQNTPALWGLYRSLIANIVEGVSKGFEKKLEIQGVGYRAESKGDELVLQLGYSHPISIKAPQGIKISVEGNNLITVSGVDKQVVGQVAADIRNKRKPEPYKGKGIRYEGEHVKQKVGKRAAGAGEA